VKAPQKRKVTPKIVSYRITLTKELNGKYTWACPVWFTKGFFADAWIKCTDSFDSEKEARENMNTKLKLFGITAKTKNLNVRR
jgi:hypothetical protein